MTEPDGALGEIPQHAVAVRLRLAGWLWDLRPRRRPGALAGLAGWRWCWSVASAPWSPASGRSSTPSNPDSGDRRQAKHDPAKGSARTRRAGPAKPTRCHDPAGHPGRVSGADRDRGGGRPAVRPGRLRRTPGPATVAELAGAQLLLVAGDPPVGYARMEMVDGQAHLEGLSVRPSSMRRGIGSALVRAVCDQAAGGRLHRDDPVHVRRGALERPVLRRPGLHRTHRPS